MNKPDSLLEKEESSATQEQALRVNAIKYSIDKTRDIPRCKLFNEKTKV